MFFGRHFHRFDGMVWRVETVCPLGDVWLTCRLCVVGGSHQYDGPERVGQVINHLKVDSAIMGSHILCSHQFDIKERNDGESYPFSRRNMLSSFRVHMTS